MRIETRRAIALNPKDPQNLGPLGTLMAASGFREKGVSIHRKGHLLDGGQVVGVRKTPLVPQ